ncbi:MAG TPA: hypothetical protein PLB89_06255 [Flavobacteriales bacterium]|nr:hypothetical protein [Flavobacteriales bacterium]
MTKAPDSAPIAPSRPIILAWVGAFLFFAWASVDYNNKIFLDNWHSDLRADAGGYYSYLPGFFHHGFRANMVSDSMVFKGGDGFRLDREKDRIVTKYTCGTAVLQLPFFLVAESIEGFGATDGWSRTHHRAIEIAGILYWTLGLFFLFLTLQRWWPETWGLALLVVGCVAFGTNSFYYAFRSPGYCHVYAFFLVALSMYALHADGSAPMRRSMRWLFMIANALIVLVRPVDVLAVLALYGLLFMTHPALLRWKRLYVEQFVIGAVVVFPQLLYWKFVHGQWVVYSYGEEGFRHWAAPMWKEVLMSPMNGLLPNAPMFFLLPLAIGALFLVRRSAMAWLLLALFSAVVYTCSAWHAWHFGCSYGQRPMVEYVPFLALGLWALFVTLKQRWPAILHGALPLLTLLCFLHYRAMLHYDVCYRGGEWDWAPYGRNLIEAIFGKIPF